MDTAKRVLIVDDEPNVRLMLQTALESAGYEVIEAADGLAALDRLSGPGGRSCCDLVLLDLRMPRMDGLELLSRLRAGGILVPVVMLTAHGRVPEAVAAMKLGAIDFLTKPITPDALRAVVAEVIARHASPAEHSPAREVAPHLAAPAGAAFSLSRAKRALNRGQFAEAEQLLAEIIASDPRASDAILLSDRLRKLKEEEEQGSFRVLRDWFPSGTTRARP